MNKLLKAMHFRHACKAFDENKEIAQDKWSEILESGIMSPSSFGMEPTRILVIDNKELKEKMREVCWNQIQLTSCSKLVVLKSLVGVFNHKSNYLENMSLRRGKTKEEQEAFLQKFMGFLDDRANHGQRLEEWVGKQAYIMASSMMNYAAYIGIDSCAIEGFDIDGVNKVLEIDTFKECVSLILTFGYRIKEQQKRYRLPINEIVEYRG